MAEAVKTAPKSSSIATKSTTRTPARTTPVAKTESQPQSTVSRGRQDSFRAEDSRRDQGSAAIGSGASALVSGLQDNFSTPPAENKQKAGAGDTAEVKTGGEGARAETPQAANDNQAKVDTPEVKAGEEATRTAARAETPQAANDNQAKADTQPIDPVQRKEANRQKHLERVQELKKDEDALKRQIGKTEKAAAKDNPVAKKLLELSQDADHNGKVTPQSLREGKAFLRMEQRGELEGVQRGPKGTDAIDGKGQTWDLKSPVSDLAPGKGGYSDAKLRDMVNDKLTNGTNVVVDKDRLNPVDRAKVDQLIKDMGSQWDGKVKTYTTRPEQAGSVDKPAAVPEQTVASPDKIPQAANDNRPKVESPEVKAGEDVTRAAARGETPQAANDNLPARAGKVGVALDKGLNGLAVAGGLVQGYTGVQQLANAQNVDDVVKGGANVGAGTANVGSGLAGLKGATKLAGKLGAAGAFIDGASDLYRGVTTGDKEALALGTVKGAAGALMLVPGGQLAGGALLLGTAVYENREWLADKIGSAWKSVTGWW